MEPTELLRLVGEQLDRIGCQRFTTGSVASMVFGEPRFTNDIGMFNIIHVPSGLKADIIVAAGGAFDASRFSRVRHIELPDGRIEPFSSPEDVILKKLEFYREGGSQKHVRDIASMIAVQGVASLDWPYLEHWAERLGVAAGLDLVRPKP